jgi:hypothetical protein
VLSLLIFVALFDAEAAETYDQNGPIRNAQVSMMVILSSFLRKSKSSGLKSWRGHGKAGWPWPWQRFFHFQIWANTLSEATCK